MICCPNKHQNTIVLGTGSFFVVENPGETTRPTCSTCLAESYKDSSYNNSNQDMVQAGAPISSIVPERLSQLRRPGHFLFPDPNCRGGGLSRRRPAKSTLGWQYPQQVPFPLQRSFKRPSLLVSRAGWGVKQYRPGGGLWRRSCNG